MLTSHPWSCWHAPSVRRRNNRNLPVERDPRETTRSDGGLVAKRPPAVHGSLFGSRRSHAAQTPRACELPGREPAQDVPTRYVARELEELIERPRRTPLRRRCGFALPQRNGPLSAADPHDRPRARRSQRDQRHECEREASGRVLDEAHHIGRAEAGEIADRIDLRQAGGRRSCRHLLPVFFVLSWFQARISTRIRSGLAAIASGNRP
jgi:hypothetical protein